jgi:sugar lactone lactonase YvrE
MNRHPLVPSARRPCVGIALLAVGTLLLGACGEAASSPSAEVTIDTLPNGAVHVRSPEAGIWADGERWRLVEEVRIGAMDGTGPDIFGNVTGLEADGEGRIYVADSQASEIRIFGADGAHLRTLGRTGSGPGEFRQISGLAWHPDGSLWVNDPQNARFSALDPESGFLESHRREVSYQQIPWPGRLDSDGNLYEVALAEGDGSPWHRQRLIVRYAPPEFEPVDTLPLPVFEAPSFEHTSPDGSRMTSTQVPFAPMQVWSIAANGDVWIGTTDRYRIHRIGRSGDTLRIVERRATPVPVTATERQEEIERLAWFTDQGGRIDPSRIPDTKPAYGYFVEDDRGYIWVSAVVAAGEALRFDVFDPEGRYLGGVEAPKRGSFPVIRGDRLYLVLRDELDVQYVASYRIEGRG